MQANSSLHKHTDFTYLKEIANGSNQFIIEMMTLFIEQIPQSLIRMESALKNKDWSTLRLVVHKIKPSIMFMGLREIATEVPLVEKYAAEESHLDAIPAMVDRIKTVCTETVMELKGEREKMLAEEV